MSKELAVRILQQYGVQPQHIHAAQKGYRNESYATTLMDGHTLNLVIYKREPDILGRIKNAHYVSDFLAAQGVRVRQTVDPRIVRLGTGHKYAALYTYLPGTTIPWEAYTMEHIKQLGGAMSTMHALLRPLLRQDLPLIISQSQALLARMQAYFAQKGVQRALTTKLNLYPPKLDFGFKRYQQLPAQPLHMDFVRGNILFSDEPKVTGILDLEKAAWGPPVFDIARTLAFLLVDCKYKSEDKVRKYFLLSGYNKRGRATFQPSPLLEHLVDFFLLHDFYKFLRHNPYESLQKNEHFVRTRDFLLKRNILIHSKMLE